MIGRVLPADPVGAIVGELADPAAYAAMRQKLGLDLPIYQQFLIYLKGLAHGDFGTAVLTGNPVSSDLAQAFPATFELATLAILISTFVGVPLGLTAALFRDSFIDKIARDRGACRSFDPGLLVRDCRPGDLLCRAELGWRPGTRRCLLRGHGDAADGAACWSTACLQGETEIFWNALGHIILPAVILAYAAMAYITRMTRSFTLEQLSQDYVIAARAKGVGPARTVIGHVLPNIAVQLITILAISYGGLLEGAVVTEIVFSWPGIGQYMTNALMIGDMNAVVAGTIIIGFIFMFLNFLADIAYAIFDPRTREAAQ